MTKTRNTTLAWHFTTDKLRDGRPLPEVGKWLKHEGPLKICESGLHASERLLDAMQYVPPNATLLHRVELAGELRRQTDKLCATERRIVASHGLNLECVVRLACEAAALAAWCAGVNLPTLIDAAEAADRGDWTAAARAADVAACAAYVAAVNAAPAEAVADVYAHAATCAAARAVVSAAAHAAAAAVCVADAAYYTAAVARAASYARAAAAGDTVRDTLEARAIVLLTETRR